MNSLVKLTHPDAQVPEYQTSGSAGFDIAIVERTSVFFHGGPVLARTGLIIKSPKDHFLLVAPRSSTFKKWGVCLANSVGVVDPDYCGDEDEILLNLVCLGHLSHADIPAGTRIAQGLFLPSLRADFWVTENMGVSSRGGWGSTNE